MEHIGGEKRRKSFREESRRLGVDFVSALAKLPGMRILLMLWTMVAACVGAPVDDFVAAAREKHGEAGEKAAQFLVKTMPAKDAEKLTAGFLIENLDLAFKARAEFPWGKEVAEEMFHNDVLPYAVFDEARDAWRADFLARARPLVKEAKTASEAAQILNREFFKLVNVHYNTGRKRANQSPRESMESGIATCTGLSIILVDACRAVGIPARAVGTPMWSNNSGNHTWVEIWDHGWQFTGADEYDKDGLNRGWFVENAAKARAEIPKYAIYATSWRNDGLHFPLVWAQNSAQVGAVNVTSRYTAGAQAQAGHAQFGVRLVKYPGSHERLAAKVEVLDAAGVVLAEALTKAGTADFNDMARMSLKPGTTGSLRFTLGEESRSMPLPAVVAGESIHDAAWSTMGPAPKLAAPKVTPALAAIRDWLALPAAERKADAPALAAALTRTEAAQVTEVFGKELLARLAIERKPEMDAKVITLGDKKMPWLEKTFGTPPADGASLWISMHGGGGAPKEVNDEQWQNQIQLYQPSEGIYLAPRAPSDNWNLWHEDHIDPMFQRLIEDFVALRGVNPNKVYLMGYSAGGDGVWQLAPRMADRFAAASMMAGHPNEASLLGLRNLPFGIFMGGADSAYKRNTVAAERAAQLGELEKADPGAYIHLARIYPGSGHWMNLQDAESLPWMAKFQRNPWPKKIVWLQDDVRHERFYWLKIPAKAAAKAGEKIVASIEGQTVTLEGDVPAKLELRLSDALLDLDKPVKVVVNGKEVSNKVIARTAGAIWRSLQERADVQACGSALLELL